MVDLDAEQEAMRQRNSHTYTFNEVDGVVLPEKGMCPYCRRVETKVDQVDGHITKCSTCVRLTARLKQYHISIFEFYTILREQDGRCAICRREFDAISLKKIHIDHCHDLGHVRGLLCSSCNIGLGMFQDDENVVVCASKYLKFNRLRRRWRSSKNDLEI